MAIQKNNKSAFHAPLHPLECEGQTYGGRYTTPEFCAKNRLPQVCALVRKAHICLAPPQFWRKQFEKFQAEQFATGPASGQALIGSISIKDIAMRLWFQETTVLLVFGFVSAHLKGFQTCAFAKDSLKTKNPRCPSLPLFCQCFQ